MTISIIYHSETGNTKAVAELIAEAAQEVEGIRAVVMSVDGIDPETVRESNAVIFGCPTYCGTFSWQLKKFFDTTKLDLEGRLGAVFVTENYLGGGADAAELAIVGMMLVRGMLAYSAGFTKPGPMTHYGAVTIKSGDEWQRDRARHLGKRVAEKAIELFRGVPAAAER